MTTKPLPHQWLPGADAPNSLAQAIQENFDALATAPNDRPPVIPRVVWSSEPGPLTLSSTQTMRGGRVLSLHSGAGYLSSGTGLISSDLYVDGVSKVGSIVFANEASSHRATPMAGASFTVTAGPHTFELRTAGGTNNADDRFTLILLEF